MTHQFDIPFIPGEPTIPVPQLGNVGLPAGDYTVTTSITFGLAQASVDASAAAHRHQRQHRRGRRRRRPRLDGAAVDVATLGKG